MKFNLAWPRKRPASKPGGTAGMGNSSAGVARVAGSPSVSGSCEGGGAAIHTICAALQDALKPVGAPIVSDSCNPPHRVWELIQHPGASRAGIEVVPA